MSLSELVHKLNLVEYNILSNFDILYLFILSISSFTSYNI